MVEASPAWNPQATLALVTTESSSRSPSTPSPTSAFRSGTRAMGGSFAGTRNGLATTCAYDRSMERIDRLPEQYFGSLLGRVAATAGDGESLIDLGRGNPETGPPADVVETLTLAAGRADV